MSDAENNCKVRFHQVVQKFRLVHDRPATFRQAFVRFFREPAQVQIFEALRGVSFTVRAGETVGILGRNGSGKSTILKIIASVYHPTSGTVEVDGRVSPLIELGAGFHPELTGRENIVLSGALMGIEPKEMQRRTEAIIDFAELSDFIDVPVKQYSSGMYARLGFAVATEIDPDILLVDEILAVGDGAFQQKCLERMHNFQRRGKTIVFVSHDLSAVKSLCNRALLLDHGRLMAQGPATEVADQYQLLLESSAASDD
jgi:ABC-type polysaccharide/polyol phosphate transport system ATPase subunit